MELTDLDDHEKNDDIPDDDATGTTDDLLKDVLFIQLDVHRDMMI